MNKFKIKKKKFQFLIKKDEFVIIENKTMIIFGVSLWKKIKNF